MNIGIFAYNFKHWKTQEGIINLTFAGRKPKVIFAADPVKLNFYKSKKRIVPKDLFLKHPAEIAKFLDIDYKVVVHNSLEVNNLVKEYDLDLGIILGARILKPVAFKDFKIGVMNMHPGVLPENRGLDTVKWAIINDYDQGVTSHLINRKIDQGHMIKKEKINIYSDDTFLDIQLRIQNLEQKIMLDSISILENEKNILKEIERGNYHKSVPPDIELRLEEKFKLYKERRCHR
jgi:folate-dependent phosphoribosylglycinamide formyltransferase PurN